MKPYVVDLFCGLGGWSKGFLSEGYDAYGFDIERHQYGDKQYPGKLILKDARTLHGSQFAKCAAIVASPPCQEFSYMAMPWSRAKQIAAALRGAVCLPDGTTVEKVPFPDDYLGSRTLAELTELFDTPFRLQREASEAAGRIIPLVVENVKGAQPWVGRAKGHYGSYYLWGDIESVGGRLVRSGVPKFGESIRPAKRALKGRNNFHFFENTGLPSPSFHGAEHEASVQRAVGLKTVGHVNQRNGHDHTRHLTNQRESDAVKVSGISFSGYGEPGYKAQGFNVVAAQRYRELEGVKQRGSGAEWFDEAVDQRRREAADLIREAEGNCPYAERGEGPWRHGSKSDSRKAASAMIAEIPFGLAQWIARILKP